MRARNSLTLLVVVVSLLLAVSANLCAQEEGDRLNAEALPVRTWTSDQHRRRASFVDCQRDVVRLREPDGTLITIQFERLSDVDQQYVRSLVAAHVREPLLLPDTAWLSADPIRRESVTEALNGIAKLSPEEARKEAEILPKRIVLASAEGRRAIALLVGVLLEQSQLTDEAVLEYTKIIDSMPDTPFAASAQYRKRLIEASGAELPDDVYWELAGVESARSADSVAAASEEPAMPVGGSDLSNDTGAADGERLQAYEIEGWFVVSGEWIWSTSRAAALLALLEQRESELSFRSFAYLQSLSTFPAAYGYLFILLVLTVGARVLTLPLNIKATRVAVKIRRLRTQITAIRETYADNLLEQGQQTAALYKRHGINSGPGCLVLVLDLVFFCWVLVSMSSYRPQLMLDHAHFFMVEDVTRFSPHLVGAFVAIGMLTSLTNKALGIDLQPAVHIILGSLFAGCVLMGIAAYFEWPGYAFIFWNLLTLLRLLFSFVLLPACIFAESIGSRHAKA